MTYLYADQVLNTKIYEISVWTDRWKMFVYEIQDGWMNATLHFTNKVRK